MTIDKNISNGSHYKKHIIMEQHVGMPLDPALIVDIRGGDMRPMLFTALKKILEPGKRGGKSYQQDITDAIGALERELVLCKIMNVNAEHVLDSDKSLENLPNIKNQFGVRHTGVTQ